jgi:plasmid stabilization system protein ParE
VVKELDDPASRRLAIVVDLRGAYDAAEAAATRAAGLAVRALREGLAVTMATAESGEGRVAAVKTRIDVSRRLARAVAAVPPEGPFPTGVEVVRVTAQDRHE